MGKMTARGVDFLEEWTVSNVTYNSNDTANAGVLAAKLLADGAAAGFTLPDMGLDDETAETFIRSTMLHLNEPGTPGD